MFYVKRLDVVSGEPFLWESIESSWEFINPTARLDYACKIAKNLALRSDGDGSMSPFWVEKSA